jgi:hypothetical protein
MGGGPAPSASFPCLAVNGSPTRSRVRVAQKLPIVPRPARVNFTRFGMEYSRRRITHLLLRVVALRRMTFGNRAGPFPKTPRTTTLSKVVNGLVYGSSLLAAAVSSDHVFKPEARSDILKLKLKLFTTRTVCAGLHQTPYAPVAVSGPSQLCHTWNL